MLSEVEFVIEQWSCPLPLRDYPRIVMGHGGGGSLSAELIENLFVPAFRNDDLEAMADSTVLTLPAGRIAFSTDAYVVHPLFFPGGSIGELAVHGTCNDLSMSGARPLYLSASFILEEGLEMKTLAAIVDRMAQAARDAGVRIVTGDTKVVERGHADGCYITTAGIGVVMTDHPPAPSKAKVGDVVLVSGTLGDHGMTVMSRRENLSFETVLESDSAALHPLVEAMLAASGQVHVLRDPTRGGLATSLNEIAQSSRVGIRIDETALPVRPAVASACEILGMDPVYIANEGKLVAIVAPEDAERVLQVMRANPLGHAAAIIGEVVADHRGTLVERTRFGATRILPLQIGEQLPRIC
ncbi:Hydrogenase maturation protein, carbamoyl dehydratase HypE [Bryocella elongata]|uniref:Hydrogenase maturation protein, carbamoyl dehydratase HypE n=1 Tax=Bryocella elongata TaxID=863522 RepID=A0A1H6CAN0_9BACT|nr:hydrogenase expression/formation protein HypE [Bryocella elongata]SEG70011.1 Hydrogenase maturation protein, carbamoyl dehydratase HypE [Bryocella elongata]